MRAAYKIYMRTSGAPALVDSVKITVEDNPNSPANCTVAIGASGRSASYVRPGDPCPTYQAHFVGYVVPTVEVPVAVMAQVVELVNKNRYHPLVQDSPRVLRLQKTLIACGCAVENGCDIQLVDSE